MRTTVTLADDVAAAVQRLRHERSVGVSEAVNDLIRQGLTAEPSREPFVQETFPMGAKVDLTNIGKALEEIEGPAAP